MIERSVMVRWVVGSILHVGPYDLFSFQPVLHDWGNKGFGMCHPICGIVHIKDPLLLIEKSSPFSGGSGFPLSLSEQRGAGGGSNFSRKCISTTPLWAPIYIWPRAAIPLCSIR